MAKLKAPFPWFGGKSRVAHLIWDRLGNVPNYVEPFAGSLAVLLARPFTPKVETVNDADCYLANFWRALAADSDAVARYANWPVNEADLSARREWLLSQGKFVNRMKTDPDYFDAKIAGWWVWGVSQSIGDGWCGMALKKEMAREIPHLGNPGTGIHRSSLPHLGDPGKGIQTYLALLAYRLRRVRVVCGDWSRVLTPSVTTKHGLTGVFLDPPYDGYENIYTRTAFAFSDVAKWAFENGDNPDFRIALCGYDLEPPANWDAVTWTANRGYSTESENRYRETLLFSPHCIRKQDTLPFLSIVNE